MRRVSQTVVSSEDSADDDSSDSESEDAAVAEAAEAVSTTVCDFFLPPSFVLLASFLCRTLLNLRMKTFFSGNRLRN